MIAGFTLDFLAILVGALGMLSLLVLLFGRQAPIVPYAEPFHDEDDSRPAIPDPAAPDDAEEPFLAMPQHLKTRAEMVAWMTQELPKLTESMATKQPRN